MLSSLWLTRQKAEGNWGGVTYESYMEGSEEELILLTPMAVIAAFFGKSRKEVYNYVCWGYVLPCKTHIIQETLV